MKTISSFLFILFLTTATAQDIVPLMDFNGFFRCFQDGFFRQIEFQRIIDYKGGDNIVAYLDNRGNLRAFDGTNRKEITNLEIEYDVSDNLLIWSAGETLNMWDHGFAKTLSFNAGRRWVKDSIIVFEDKRYNSFNVYYNQEVYTLYTSTNALNAPDFIGDNIVAFRDNGNFHKIFWRGKIYDIDVWHDRFQYQGAADVMAFNDLITGTFVVFENGQFVDVEDFHMPNYKAGRGFIVYENQNGELIYYGNGVKKTLSNFAPDEWQVNDDVVVWSENGYTYAHMYLSKVELARFEIEDMSIKNGVVAFRNAIGGVSALMDGKIYEITTQMNSSYKIYGNSVLVELFNNSFIVLQEGRKYTL